MIRELADVENPFKPVEDSPVASSDPRTIEVDRLKAPEIAIAGDHWEVELAPIEKLDFEPEVIPLPKKIGFFEKISHVVINTQAKRAAVFYSLGKRDKVSTRILMLDIQAGDVLCNETIAGKFTAYALHNDGQRIVVQHSSGGDDQGVLSTIRWQRHKDDRQMGAVW